MHNVDPTERIDWFFADPEYGFLCNFYDLSPNYLTYRVPGRRPVRVKTTEHAFQADKFIDTDPAYAYAVAKAIGPGAAKWMGKDPDADYDDKAWKAVRVDRMRCWLQLKFAIPRLRAMLLSTGCAELVEGNTWDDVVWGVIESGEGQNLLGQLLMEERARIRGEYWPLVIEDRKETRRLRRLVEKRWRKSAILSLPDDDRWGPLF